MTVDTPEFRSLDRSSTALTPERACALPPQITRDYLLYHRVCPAGISDSRGVVVAVAADALLEALDEIAAIYAAPIEIREVDSDELVRMIERLTNISDPRDGDEETGDVTTDVREIANQPPVVRYVNMLLRDAYEAGASDIHMESSRNGLRSRIRLDGVLTQIPEAPRNLHQAIVSRVKLMADLDISERRRPQDGRLRVRLEDSELDLRVSTAPTVHGESVVLRLLDRGSRPVTLHDLGMPDAMLERLLRETERPHGMLIATGPTGSGKTTTLYSALRRRNALTEKVITVEDPVEYQLDGITQVPVHRQAGVTFASALRAILRQDPDVIMIGEMRDPETAEVAMQAASTGHLVFSTLHTNDAIGAIGRLADLAVPPYMIAASLTAVIAQRLVRRPCGHCARADQPDPGLLASLAGSTRDGLEFATDARYVKAVGCSECRGTGFRGRIALFELVLVDDSFRVAIVGRATHTDLVRIAKQSGYQSMIVDGLRKAAAGLTTLDEIVKVAHV